MENNNILQVKNYLSDEDIKKLYNKLFKSNTEDINITKLTGGLKNAVYLIECKGEKVVLKTESCENKKTITLDKNAMWWEASMMKELEELDIPSPKLLYFDGSCNDIKYPYIFMSYLEGNNYLEEKGHLSEQEREYIDEQVGEICKKISKINKNEYFIPTYSSKKIANNYEFILTLFDSIIKDATLKNIKLNNIEYEEIYNLLSKNKNVLKNNEKISLCHADLWDGNILVKDNRVSGIIDFADMYFGDELFTFYFHTLDGVSEKFLKGYGKEKLTETEKLRIDIYEMFTIFKMIVDCDYKGYGKYDWMYKKFDEKFSKAKQHTLCYNRQRMEMKK